MEVRVRYLKAEAKRPAYAREGDAGLDLFAVEHVRIGPSEFKTVWTGIAVELPPGTQGEVRPRSGLAREHGVTVLNGPGTVDEGYRGEIGVLLINHGSNIFDVEPGMRVGQLVVQRRLEIELVEVDELAGTERGSGGFGSTGQR